MKYIKNGNRWSLTSATMDDIRDELPPGNYTVCFNDLSREYFLETTADFQMPDRLYGKIEQYAARISSSFESRKPGGQVGVLLSGSKGSGKTLLAKYLSLKLGLPTLIVNTNFHDELFMRTLQGIKQPAIFIIDEFEKLYNTGEQQDILTMFDGVYTLRDKLVIITCNDKFSVQSCFHNRPGRLRYSIDFEGLDESFIREYCGENLGDASYLPSIVKFCTVCEEVNFDMLQTLVSELNAVGGPFEEVVEILNVKPAFLAVENWEVTVTTPDFPEKSWKVQDGIFEVSPVSYFADRSGSGAIYIQVKSVGSEDLEMLQLRLTISDMLQANSINRFYSFEVEESNVRYIVTFRSRNDRSDIRRLAF